MLALVLCVLAVTGGTVYGQEPTAPSPGIDSPPPGSPGASPSVTPRPQRSREPLPSLPPLPPLDPNVPPPHLAHEVMAYLPYWMVDGSFNENAPRYDPTTDPYVQEGRLTDLVLFSVGVRRDGSLRLDTAGADLILGDAGTRIIKTAHAHGIRVLASFTSGGYANNDALFGDPVAQARFVTDASALVRLRGLDGADMDVELIHKPRFAAYAATAGALRAALVTDNPRARVTVATNGNKSGATMASMALAAGADRAFLMGYAYRGPTSSPVGSISPIDRADGLDLRESLAMYADKGIPMDRVIVGLPAYGMAYATVGPELHALRAPARVSARGRTFLFSETVLDPPPASALYDVDTAESSARATWFEPGRGTWFQVYYDTPQTLRAKYLLAHEVGLAGVGMWTLGYDGAVPAYADLVRDTFARPVVASVIVDPPVLAELAVTVGIRLFDGVAPTDAVRLSNDGQTWSDWLPATATLDQAWTLADGPDGMRIVSVQSRDTGSDLSAVVSANVMIDRGPPVIDTLELRALAPGAWLVSLHATDASGVRSIDLRWRIGTGDWGPWQPLDSLAAAARLVSPGTTVTVEVRAADSLGNVSLLSESSAP